MPPRRSSHPAASRCVAAALLLFAALPAARASADLLVRVTGIQAPLGQIGCSLFAEAGGFPMDSARAKQQWLPAQGDGVTCQFRGLAPGRYAVSVGHDLNGNRRVDTNLFGVPTEPWGVSNNARPALRAPRFEEAAFTIPGDGAELILRIEIAR